MKQKTILITGATGFLGSYITRELLELGCHLKLLVRKKTNIEARERFSEVLPAFMKAGVIFDTLPDRIEIIEGDISKVHLGLNSKEFFRLAKTVDEVFHCAAATKFDNDANDVLTRTNILGTKYVACFCAMGKIKRLHYISTAYVAGRRRDTVFENELENGPLFNNDYEKSKFDTEKNLSMFANEHKIPYTIYRPSIITGDTVTGYTNNYDNIYMFGKALSYFKNKIRNNNTELIKKKGTNYRTSLRIPGDKYSTINLIPVDYASRAIVAISRQPESINNTYHIVNLSPPTLSELAEWMKIATDNHQINIVPLHEFQMQPQTLMEKLFLQRIKAFQPYMFGEPCFDSTNTRNLLSGTGIQCPLITLELINCFINYAVDTNWGRKEQDAVVQLLLRETVLL